MRKVPGWPLIGVSVAMIAVVAATVLRTPEFDNAIAYLFIGAALIMVGAWLALIIHDHHKAQLEEKEDA